MADFHDPPDDELGREMHAQLLTGSRIATSRIADAYYKLVVQHLHRINVGEKHKHLLDEAAGDAFMNLFDHPERYDPEKKSLLGYLKMSAQGDYLNRLKSEKRRSDRHREPAQDVEDGEGSAEMGLELDSGLDVEGLVIDRSSPVWENLERLLPDPVDLTVVIMMMDGVRDTEPYAILLGITDLPEAAQAHEVKKVKDRIRRKIQRNLDPAELRHDD